MGGGFGVVFEEGEIGAEAFAFGEFYHAEEEEGGGGRSMNALGVGFCLGLEGGLLRDFVFYFKTVWYGDGDECARGISQLVSSKN